MQRNWCSTLGPLQLIPQALAIYRNRFAKYGVRQKLQVRKYQTAVNRNTKHRDTQTLKYKHKYHTQNTVKTSTNSNDRNTKNINRRKKPIKHNNIQTKKQ